MQGDDQTEGAHRVDLVYIGSNSGRFNKIGVAGSRFLRGVADEVEFERVAVMCMSW